MQHAHKFLSDSETSNKLGACGGLLEATRSNPQGARRQVLLW